MELDYYPLEMAATISNRTIDFLLRLATENKISMYLKLPYVPVKVIDRLFMVEFIDCREPPELYKIPAREIESYLLHWANVIWDLDCCFDSHVSYRLYNSISLNDVTALVSAEDLARLLKKETKKNTMSETERNTMLKLIIGMAIDAYGYKLDSTRNTATGDKNGISAKLQTHGITLSDDTIRNYLNEAKKLL